MNNGKYLSEIFEYSRLKKGTLNLIVCPTGCGKTYWALNDLSKHVSLKCRMLYLIDTINGKEQILHNNDTQIYSMEWDNEVNPHMAFWVESEEIKNKIPVMTYAAFGALYSKQNDKFNNIEIILCDELHSLPKFSNIKKNIDQKVNYHKIAIQAINSIVSSNTQIIGITATPDKVLNTFYCPKNLIEYDKNILKSYSTNNTIPYTNIYSTLDKININSKGILFTAQIKTMKELNNYALYKGIKSIPIWSISNEEHMMTDEQKRVRKFILDYEAIPDEYDLLIINVSSETCINIYGHIDYMIVHSQDDDTRVQVRGRYRGDLETLYLLDYENSEIIVPDNFLNRQLFTEDKKELCKILNSRNEYGQRTEWTTMKKRLPEHGYIIEEGRTNNKRFVVITK